MTRFGKVQHLKKRAFLAAYAQCGNITRAAEIAEIDRSLHYKWMASNHGYEEAFREAEMMACESLEAEARRRAVEGWDEPVFYKGHQCGGIRKYSDTLLIFLMKGAMSEKYRERQQVEHLGNKDNPLTMVLTSDQDVP